MKWRRLIFKLGLLAMLVLSLHVEGYGQAAPIQSHLIHGGDLTIEVYEDGSYALRSSAIPGNVIRSVVEAEMEGQTLSSSLYPQHRRSTAPFHDGLGSGHLLTVVHTGLPGKPELICELRVYDNQPWGDIRVTLHNSTGAPIGIHAIRILKTTTNDVLRLNGPAKEDRVLSDSFSEDTPQLKLMDLGETSSGIHRAFGSQLVYNRLSGQSLFMGALSADRLLTVFHLLSSGHPDAHLLSYDIEDTGTGEALREQSEQGYSAANTVPFNLHVAAGASISSERLMFAIGPDYHQQLENYGRAIRMLHKPNLSMPTPIGWWSWTAYYYGVTEGTVLTNAAWLAQNLAPLGYKYFQVDEGYQYTRGEYATPDGKAFPRGMAYVGDHVSREGLTFGLWVAPFQVSERSWVYEHHRDWLIHNLSGEPIHIGKVGGKFDELYALDTTNPGAQEYLRQTYRTLVNDWGVRFIKMDFMDSTAVEGVFYRPDTTALEAQRIGLEVIRAAVGDDVILDKDGSPMLTPVGIVNTGRISQDTGHTFESTRDAAAGIAARYYMNRNFYISDPDAFTVSTQTIPDRGWHGNKRPLTLDEAEVSIALSAVSGGMFEIGDDLPTLGTSTERLALVQNADLLDIARLGKAAVPLDLMTYQPEDRQPSIFLLKEDRRQQILVVFNWTEEERSHTFKLETLGLKANGSYAVSNVLRGGTLPIQNDALAITQPAHSVRIVKLIDPSVPESPPAFEVHAPSAQQAGSRVDFHASMMNADTPALEYHWEFGDGVSADGMDVSHTYTQARQYTATVTAKGLNARTTHKALNIAITGVVPTAYDPALKERYSKDR